MNSVAWHLMTVWVPYPTCCWYPACLMCSMKSAVLWDTQAREVSWFWTCSTVVEFSPIVTNRAFFCRAVGEDVGLPAGLQCSRQVHSGKCWVDPAHPSWRLHASESAYKPLHPVQDAHEAHLQSPALDAHLPRGWAEHTQEFIESLGYCWFRPLVWLVSICIQ